MGPPRRWKFAFPSSWEGKEDEEDEEEGENDYYSRILIRSAQNHTPPPLGLGTFNENPCAKTVFGAV